MSDVDEDSRRGSRRTLWAKLFLTKNDFHDEFRLQSIWRLVLYLVAYFFITITTSIYWFGYSPLQSVFFAVNLFSSVGYGNSPSAVPQQNFTSFLMIVGGLGFGMGIFRSLYVDLQDQGDRMAQRRNLETVKRFSIFNDRLTKTDGFSVVSVSQPEQKNEKGGELGNVSEMLPWKRVDNETMVNMKSIHQMAYDSDIKVSRLTKSHLLLDDIQAMSHRQCVAQPFGTSRS